jgi:hypothetical protein
MKKQLLLAILTVTVFGCGKYTQVEQLPERGSGNQTVSTQPVSEPVTVNISLPAINVNVGGDNINNSNNNNAEGGYSSATGTGGNSSANGGNSSANANNSGSSNNTNSGSASNQANNSTNNSSDNTSNVSGSGNSTNTNTNNNSAEVDLDLDFDFNIELEADEDYFERVRRNRTRAPRQCVDPQQGRNFLCHAYDFTGRNNLQTQLAGAPHLGSFYMDKFDVTARDWQQGFPKFPASLSHLLEYYAVRCFTKLKVTEAGMHTFSITSDDGMRVLLNGSPVVQDDGLHSPRTTTSSVNLVKGLYNMEVQWFQGPRQHIAAEIKWSTPSNSTLRYIEPSDTQKAKKLCQ